MVLKERIHKYVLTPKTIQFSMTSSIWKGYKIAKGLNVLFGYTL